jgi:hypothetical protein
MVRLQRRTEPCTAGKLPKDSGVDGRRGGTYLLPSRGGVYPAGPGSDATWRGGRHGVRSDGRRKGRNDGTGSTRHGAADAMRCGVTACGRGGAVALGTLRETWHGR